MNLVTVASKEDNDAVLKYMNGNDFRSLTEPSGNQEHRRHWWTGGTNQDGEGDYFWIADGSSLNVTDLTFRFNNLNNAGSEHCVEIGKSSDSSDYKFNVENCQKKLHFICES